jgi:hypothetical protein
MVWAPKGLGSPTPMALPDHGHSLCLYSWLLAAFLGRHFMFLATLISGVLHCDFCFTIIASYVVFSGACCKDPALATHCLVSQAFFWNLGGWPSDLIFFHSSPAEPAPHGWHQDLLPAEAVARPSCTLAQCKETPQVALHEQGPTELSSWSKIFRGVYTFRSWACKALLSG